MKRTLLFFTVLFLALTVSARRPKVGLVLSGGGARGAAEIGALKFIDKYEIPIDYIAGSSIGSIVGCLYAAGYKAEEIEKQLCDQQLLNFLTDRREDLRYKPFVRTSNPFRTDTLNYIFGFPALNFRNNCPGLLSCENVEHLIDSLLSAKGISDFSQLPIKFRCTATDFRWFKHVQEVVKKEGKVSEAVRASMAFPVVIKHQQIDNQHLIDGGMMNNLPIDVVRDMGADIAIVIDLQQAKITNDDVEQRLNGVFDLLEFAKDLGMDFVNTLIRSGLTMGRKAAAALIDEDQWGIIGWALHRPDYRKYLENLNLYSDNKLIFINPRLPGSTIASFSHEELKEMVKKGEEAAKQHKRELIRLARLTNNFIRL